MIIYTDGSCSGNPGPGGWAYVVIEKSDGKEYLIEYKSGSKLYTTNNQMEMRAVIEALKGVKENVSLTFYIDSKYVINGMTKWLKMWKDNNWRTKGKKEVKNLKQWQEIDKLLENRDITCHHVRGHSGHKWNEVVDKMARNETEKIK